MLLARCNDPPPDLFRVAVARKALKRSARGSWVTSMHARPVCDTPTFEAGQVPCPRLDFLLRFAPTVAVLHRFQDHCLCHLRKAEDVKRALSAVPVYARPFVVRVRSMVVE